MQQKFLWNEEELTFRSNAGGGGERVLWTGIKAIQTRWPNALCAVYTGDHEVTKEVMLKRVQVGCSQPLMVLMLN